MLSKTIHRALSCAIIVALSFMSNACSEDNENNEDKISEKISEALIGTWAVKNPGCFETEEHADVITFAADKEVSDHHYVDRTGYGIYKYNGTDHGSWHTDGNKVRITEDDGEALLFPLLLLIENASKDAIDFCPWGYTNNHATMVRYVEPENSLYGYWELSKSMGTYVGKDGIVHDISEGSFVFHYLYFSSKDLQNNIGYNGLIFDKSEKDPRLIHYNFDGSKITIDKVDKGRFLEGDFIVKELLDNRVVIHFTGNDGGTDQLDIDMYFDRVPTYMNQ